MHFTALELSTIVENLGMNIDSMFQVLLDPTAHLNTPGAESTRFLYIEELQHLIKLRDKADTYWHCQLEEEGL